MQEPLKLILKLYKTPQGKASYCNYKYKKHLQCAENQVTATSIYNHALSANVNMEHDSFLALDFS